MQGSSVTIQNIEFKKRNFYGGSTVRSKEIEILGELHYEFNLPGKQKTGMISAIVQCLRMKLTLRQKFLHKNN